MVQFHFLRCEISMSVTRDSNLEFRLPHRRGISKIIPSPKNIRSDRIQLGDKSLRAFPSRVRFLSQSNGSAHTHTHTHTIVSYNIILMN